MHLVVVVFIKTNVQSKMVNQLQTFQLNLSLLCRGLFRAVLTVGW